VVNSNFRWDAHAANDGDDRGVASGRLSRHVMSQLNEAYRTGALDPNKPLVVQLVGFSHGGNVALQAADDISEALKLQSRSRGRPLNAAIHVATLSTPAYQGETAGRGAAGEDPRFAAARVNADGVRFAHSHVHVSGDSVATKVAGGSSTYLDISQGGVTRNLVLPQRNWNLVDNHGAPQDNGEHMRRATEFIDSRHRGLAPSNNSRIADAGEPANTRLAFAQDAGTGRSDDGSKIASANTAKESSNAVATLVQGNEPVNRQFAQALKGANGDMDTAARAVEAISKLPGYRPDQEIAVLQGRNGLLVSQGHGDMALTAPIPQAKVGDFEKISIQMTQQPPSAQVALGQPEKQEKQEQKALIA
jgi:hypothetical protein